MRILLIIILQFCLILPSIGIASSLESQLVKSDDDFHIYRKHSRYYVIGSQETLNVFLNNGQIPYSRTILGKGSLGESVVFEIDKKNPKRVEFLQKKFENTEIAIIFY